MILRVLFDFSGVVRHAHFFGATRTPCPRLLSPSRSLVSQYTPNTMSCDGTAIGLPFAGDRMLLMDIIRTRASICASIEERHVNRHLVPVKVGVECGADERMQPDRLAFH